MIATDKHLQSYTFSEKLISCKWLSKPSLSCMGAPVHWTGYFHCPVCPYGGWSLQNMILKFAFLFLWFLLTLESCGNRISLRNTCGYLFLPLAQWQRRTSGVLTVLIPIVETAPVVNAVRYAVHGAPVGAQRASQSAQNWTPSNANTTVELTARPAPAGGLWYWRTKTSTSRLPAMVCSDTCWCIETNPSLFSFSRDS